MLKKLSKIMNPSSNHEHYKEFLKDIAKILMIQERHRMLQLQNNLYDTVQYYVSNSKKSKRNKSNSSKKSNNFKIIEDNLWTHEMKQFHALMEDEITSPTFRLTSANDLKHPDTHQTSKSILSHTGLDLSQSINSRRINTARETTHDIKTKFNNFRTYLENNTREEVISARNQMIDNKCRSKSQSSNKAGILRNAMSSTERKSVKMKDPLLYLKKAKFKIILPSELKKRAKESAKSHLKKVLSVDTSVNNQKMGAKRTLKLQSPGNPASAQKTNKSRSSFAKTPEPSRNFRNYQSQKKFNTIEQIRENKKKYTKKYKKLYYKTLKYTAEEVFKVPEKDNAKMDEESEQGVKKTLKRGKSIINPDTPGIDDEESGNYRRKSLDHEQEKELNAMRIRAACNAFRKPIEKKKTTIK